MSLLSLAMIVGGTLLVTFWTPEPPQWLMGQFQRDLHLLHLEIHLVDAPGSAQAKQLFEKFFVLHDRRILWTPSFFDPTPYESPKPRNISVIGAITLAGVQAPMMIEGPIDGQALQLYVERILVPLLCPGDTIIWDNVSIDKNTKVKTLNESRGARIEPLPAYSPDLNPKEECISKVKAELCRVKANTIRKLEIALRSAYARVTQGDIRGWMRHSGYKFT
jgi:transposase